MELFQYYGNGIVRRYGQKLKENIDIRKFCYNEEKDLHVDYNLFTKPDILSKVEEGVVVANSSDNLIIYRVGLRKISQDFFQNTILNKYGMTDRDTAVTKYNFWCLPHYFMMDEGNVYISQAIPLGNYSYVLPYPATNLWGSDDIRKNFNYEFYETCYGRAFRNLPDHTKFKNKLEHIQDYAMSFLSAPGNSDLGFRENLSSWNVGEASLLHKVMLRITVEHSKLKTEEEVVAWYQTNLGCEHKAENFWESTKAYKIPQDFPFSLKKEYNEKQ